MIQRIQSIYLVLIALLISFMYFMPIGVHKISQPTANILVVSTMFKITDKQVGGIEMDISAVGILGIIVIALSLSTIFLFRRRALQLKITRMLMLLLTGLVAMLYVYSDLKIQTLAAGQVYSSTFLIGAYAPLLAIFLAYLAMKAIRKDNELVRSADRLR